MLFKVTAVPISKRTRRRNGKAFSTVIDTERDIGFRDCLSPGRIERRFELVRDAKVVDVREVQPINVTGGNSGPGTD